MSLNLGCLSSASSSSSRSSMSTSSSSLMTVVGASSAPASWSLRASWKVTVSLLLSSLFSLDAA